MTIDRFIKIDEEGYFQFDENRVTDLELGQKLLANIERIPTSAFITQLNNTPAYCEPFDFPYVVEMVFRHSDSRKWTAILPYNHKISFNVENLRVDDWDRFIGVSDDEKRIPFVFSRKAQMEFFNLVDQFDDDGVTMDDTRIPIPYWLQLKPQSDSLQEDEKNLSNKKFWDSIYRSEDPPGWELNDSAKPLKEVLPQLKLLKSNIAVLGSGSGNDAAYFASHGHIVTGFDFSDEAIHQSHQKYGNIKNLTFEKADIFSLPDKFWGQFDVVFDHTCFCAIDPLRRNELVNVWRQLLKDDGHLLGIFFTMDRPLGPPFGTTEWELQKRLDGRFRPLYWTRWRSSIVKRQGLETVIYAKKEGAQ